jgi:hypothetical protein
MTVEPTSRSEEWTELLEVVRGEVAESVEKTVEHTRTMASYDAVDASARRALVVHSYQAALDGIQQRRRPDASDDGTVFYAAGETRGRQRVALAEMLALWRIGLENLHELARRVAPAGPRRDALLLEFLELALVWADFAMVHAAEGHRHGELSQAREQQHAQTNCVRRVLAGTAAPGEIHAALAPLGLDSARPYHAVRVRPIPSVDMHAIEQYLGVDGMVRRGNGLLALIDGDACGFVARLPAVAAPIAIGISDAVALPAMEPAFRQAGRALETALTLGVKGVFAFSDLSVHAAVTSDADVGDVMVRRYVDAILVLPAGEVLLHTVERYVANDRSIDATAKDLDVHPNTVRHRLERFEDATQRPLRETETLVELWWALERRRLT